MASTDDLRAMAYGFDQETAAVLVARYAVHKTLAEESMDSIRWLDRILIKLTKRFAEFKADDVNSFKLSREFSLFPQFIYYLRKSQFLNTFNASPDESEYYKSLIQRENVSNSLVMIQPSLMAYRLDQEQPTPVLLEADQMQDDVVLLMDTFFYICIWKGATIASWEKQGYHEDPNYANLKDLLEAPVADAQYIMQERFPMPRFFVAFPDDTNERRIKVRINASSNPTGGDAANTESFFTEDVSLNVFMKHLIKMAVQS
jgi:protein transport protein SEC23